MNAYKSNENYIHAVLMSFPGLWVFGIRGPLMCQTTHNWLSFWPHASRLEVVDSIDHTYMCLVWPTERELYVGHVQNAGLCGGLIPLCSLVWLRLVSESWGCFIALLPAGGRVLMRAQSSIQLIEAD